MFLGIALGRGMVGSIMAYAAYAANAQTPPFIADFVGGFYVANNQPTTLAGATTFARSGSATMFDSTGTLVTIADGAPRENSYLYEGGAWVNNGLQLESEVRTNLALYSNDFINIGWSKISGPSVTANAAISPDGTVNADLISFAAATDSRLQQTVSTTAAASYTFSVWLRIATGTATIRIGTSLSTAGEFLDVTVTTEWQRFNHTAAASGASEFPLIANQGGTAIDVLLFGAQFELGSTPSSYTPTAGSTVTRAAETLTASAANLPWPTPVVIGPELVTNGDFATDSDWTLTGATITGGAAVVSGAAFSQSGARQNGVMSSGVVYQVTFDIVDWVSGNIDVNIPSFRLFKRVIISGDGTYTAIGVSGGAGDLQVALAGDGTTANFKLDNISVKEINPLAVSLQISGKINYADANQDKQFTFMKWSAADGNIESNLTTIGVLTGRVDFRQIHNGGLDNVLSNVYTPGLNVPFNIASRHGSTFINGAIDGTVLTANLTPTGLANLENTDLQIAQTFMGHIHLVRVWAVDIGDTGIGVAST
jgi:hypothetical protein